MNSLLTELDELPPGLLEKRADELHEILGGPTLIHLQGKRTEPLFVSVLMHGNETTGWDAVCSVLKQYETNEGVELPRSLSLFIANTMAAEEGVRRLPDQPDYNRVWPGGDDYESPEHEMMCQVIDSMSVRGMFAALDIHNNTGLNPYYACVNVLEHQALQLASVFGRTVVYFVRPKGVASMALAALGVALTLECGKVGESAALQHTAEFIDACLHMSELPERAVAPHDVHLFHTVAVVRVVESVEFGFGDSQATLSLIEDIEHQNFRELPAGFVLANVVSDGAFPVEVKGEDDRDITTRYFEIVNGQLRTKLPVMPSMLTRNKQVITQDCLCYLMERYDQHLADAG